jgi:hypothetical protein
MFVSVVVTCRRCLPAAHVRREYRVFSFSGLLLLRPPHQGAPRKAASSRAENCVFGAEIHSVQVTGTSWGEANATLSTSGLKHSQRTSMVPISYWKVQSPRTFRQKFWETF